ncbi:MAG: LysM peptidoglycan-binding domain-containing protein [Rikenellaceae bacterium]|nr:LysM peptidoglycan-binding domain-containing protein [Rikenellaceae bacterium]
MILNTILLPLATLCAVDSTTLDQPVIVSDSTTIELSDSLYSEEELHRAEMFDSLLHTLYSNNPAGDFQFYQQDLVEIDTTQALYSEVPDSVWYHRMRNIMSAIELDYNSVVKRYLVAYTTTRKSTVSAVLGRSLYYFPLFEEQLERHGMPLELRMLPVIESALNPSARSRAGAMGIWQFMFATGRRYGLEITSFIDQRCDPVASTDAALRYLKDLYNIYGDWQLALAAYNCGPGNVNKAFKYAGPKAKTFWDIYAYLPRETRGYVPSFIAATYAYEYHDLHGINMTENALPLATDTLVITRPMHFNQVASTIDLPIETLRLLNPQYKMDIVPALNKQYSLVVPQNKVTKFIDNADAIYGKDTVYMAKYLKPAQMNPKFFEEPQSITHKVKSGETLGAIARKYRVTVKQIMNWNRLRNTTIRIGQKLVIQKNY